MERRENCHCYFKLSKKFVQDLNHFYIPDAVTSIFSLHFYSQIIIVYHDLNQSFLTNYPIVLKNPI